MAPVGAGEAVALIGWAAASGGAYGRRRGAPIGRFAAWWLIAALVDLEWPVAPERMAEAAAALEWQVWEPLDLAPGWSASITIASVEHGLAWALEAHDTYREGDDPTGEAERP